MDKAVPISMANNTG